MVGPGSMFCMWLDLAGFSACGLVWQDLLHVIGPGRIYCMWSDLVGFSACGLAW